jgi:hypothetical protein
LEKTNYGKNRKTDNGVGLQLGIFEETENYTIIIDNDINDGKMSDTDIIPTVQGQGI